MKNTDKIILMAMFVLIGEILRPHVSCSDDRPCIRVPVSAPATINRVEKALGSVGSSGNNFVKLSGQIRKIKAEQYIKMLGFLENMDSAFNVEKAKFAVNAIAWLSREVWKKEKFVISKKSLKRISIKHSNFLKQYSQKRDFSPALKKYISFDYESIARISKDAYAVAVNINRKQYLLLLFKGAAHPLGGKGNFSSYGSMFLRKDIRDFEFIAFKSESEVEKYQKIATAFAKKAFLREQNKKEEEKFTKRLYALFNPFKSVFSDSETLGEIRKAFGEESPHPDLTYLHQIGSPESKVHKLGSVQLPKIGPARHKDGKKTSLAELLEESSLRFIESLIKKDEAGNFRALTKEEIISAYKKGALMALKMKKHENSDPYLRHMIMDVLRAIKAGKSEFKSSSSFDNISFSEIKEDSLRLVLTAATIPRDEKTWIFLDTNLYQAAYALTNMLGISQKMSVFYMDYREAYRNKDYFKEIVKEVYNKTEISKTDIENKAGYLDFHNRLLERLHYSYKVDAEFKKDIDLLREKFLSQINPESKEAFRFIASDIVTAYALEFAARTGKTPLVASPFVIGFRDNLVYKQGDEPLYFMRHSRLYEKRLSEFERRYLLFDDIVTEINGVFKIEGGAQYLKHVVRAIFTYNEIVGLLNSKAYKKFINPVAVHGKTVHFSLLGHDFTRPEDSEAFSDMFPDQFFQAVESFSLEDWNKNRDDILRRYSRLAVKGEIDASDFMEHIGKLAEKDFHFVWNGSWAEGYGYYIKRAEMTRAVIETVLRYSRPDFLNDGFLAQYYSRADEIMPDGTLIYFEAGRNGERTGAQIPPSDAINNNCKPYDFQEPTGRYPLYALAMIMDISPQRIGPKTMNFIIEMIGAGKDRYALYKGDVNGFEENFYGAAAVFDIPISAFDSHPEYYAEMLLKSSLDQELLAFLIEPEISPEVEDYFFESSDWGEEERESVSFISENIIMEMVRQNTLEGNQFKLLETIISYAPNIGGDAILKEWRKFKISDLNFFIKFEKNIDNLHLEKMEYMLKKHGLKNRASALFSAFYPEFDIKILKEMDQLFRDDSVQVIFKLLEAVRSKQWTESEITALYKLNLWSRASAGVRHCNINKILSLSLKNKSKFFTAFSGNELKPQNIFDIYPLNIPKDHILYDKYSHELKHYDMSYSSFAYAGGELSESKETEDSVNSRISHRSRLLFNDLDAILKFSEEELSKKVDLLKSFETRSAEMDNTAYRLLIVAPEKDFEELYGILDENFNSLKNLKQAKEEMTKQFQQIIMLKPELKGLSEKTIVRWAVDLIGVSKRRFNGSPANQGIRKKFLEKLSETNLGRKATAIEKNEKVVKDFRVMVSAYKLLLIIDNNLKLYKSWLDEIPDIETDTGRMLCPPNPALPQSI